MPERILEGRIEAADRAAQSEISSGCTQACSGRLNNPWPIALQMVERICPAGRSARRTVVTQQLGDITFRNSEADLRAPVVWSLPSAYRTSNGLCGARSPRATSVESMRRAPTTRHEHHMEIVDFAKPPGSVS
jgi:hypothetical protein